MVIFKPGRENLLFLACKQHTDTQKNKKFSGGGYLIIKVFGKRRVFLGVCFFDFCGKVFEKRWGGGRKKKNFFVKFFFFFIFFIFFFPKFFFFFFFGNKKKKRKKEKKNPSTPGKTFYKKQT